MVRQRSYTNPSYDFWVVFVAPATFQEVILRLQDYWAGMAAFLQPLDMEVGAGTFHPATFSARAGARKLERRLCATQPTARRWPLR